MRNEMTVEPQVATALRFPIGTSERALVQREPTLPLLRTRQQAVMREVAQNELPVRYLGVMPLFTDHRVYEGRRCDWVLVDAAADPLFHDRDGFPVPERVLSRLRRVHRSGVEFDSLYVAHEVPKASVREGEPISPELLAPPSEAVGRLSKRLAEKGRKILMLPLAISADAVGSVAIGAASVAGGVASVDPVLLGTVVGVERPVTSGEPAAWFYLGHWAFNEDV